MARKRKEPERKGRRWWTGSTTDWITRLLCVSALAIPLVISPGGRDSFRLPKELAFRAEMIVLIALVLIGLIARELDWKALQWRHPAVILPLVVVAWTGVTTIASTNRALSAPALLYATGAAIVFIATFLVARERRLEMIDWILWAGIINAALYLAVALELVGNPLPLISTHTGRFAATGLLGNVNDLGTTLLPVAICASAAAVASPKRRAFHLVTALVVTAAIFVSVSVAAIGALLAAIVVMAFIWNLRRALAATLVGLAVLGGVVFAHQPLKSRIDGMATAARTAQWDEFTNGRLTAFAAAYEMFRDNPLTGTGPGTFGWQYYPHRVGVAERNPDTLGRSVASWYNFEEVHNDHLEVLGETGVPGYLLFVASLAILAAGSFRPGRTGEAADDRARFARLAALPLAAGTAVVALAQYPLQLTATLTTLLFATALCLAWSDRSERAREEVSDDA